MFDVAPAISTTRFPAQIETAVYLCCRSAIDAAAKPPASSTLAIRLWQEDGYLCFSVVSDQETSVGANQDLTAARDRITTLGGAVAIGEDAGRSTVTGKVPVVTTPDAVRSLAATPAGAVP